MEELPLQTRIGDAVDGVADHRQVDRRQVHADLVGPPRLEPHTQQGMRAEQLLHLEVGRRLAWRVRVERPARRILAVAADRRVDPPLPGPRPAADERNVNPFEGAVANQVLQPLVRLLGASDGEEAHVPRSSRWTIPGRSLSSPPAAPSSISPWTSVP